MGVKLTGKLPSHEDRNGLAPLFHELLGELTKPRLAIVVLEPSKVVRKLDDYDTEVHVTVRAIEPVDGDDLGRLRAMLQRAHADRTGNLELPAEWEQVLGDMASPTIPGSAPAPFSHQ